MDENSVVLGLSGGIDSAASAIILKEKGMNVTALYFDVINDSNSSKDRAKMLADRLEIDFVYVNLSKRFEEEIIVSFCDSYKNGLTPMPCILCNPKIKWHVLKEYADKINVKWLATGHYSKLTCINDIFYVEKSNNTFKDQSYMLAGLDQEILSRAIFPLSNFDDKNEVRDFLRNHGLNFDDKVKESQDICFVPNDYREFLKERGIVSEEGNFLDVQGNIIGRHSGYTNFTIGQRKGLGMGFGKPMFVKEINPKTNEVILCDDSDLFTNEINARIYNFAKYGNIDYLPHELENKEVNIKIRYAAKPSKAKILKTDDNSLITLKFETAQRAPAKGQFAVIYDENHVIGCAVIC